VQVAIGHAAGLEQDSSGNYVPVDGERVTEFEIPDDTSVQDAFTAIVSALPHHIQLGERPAWITADSEVLQLMLADHLGADPKKRTRPKRWGAKAPVHEPEPKPKPQPQPEPTQPEEGVDQ
jgi:hypothetical protein